MDESDNKKTLYIEPIENYRYFLNRQKYSLVVLNFVLISLIIITIFSPDLSLTIKIRFLTILLILEAVYNAIFSIPNYARERVIIYNDGLIPAIRFRKKNQIIHFQDISKLEISEREIRMNLINNRNEAICQDDIGKAEFRKVKEVFQSIKLKINK